MAFGHSSFAETAFASSGGMVRDGSASVSASATSTARGMEVTLSSGEIPASATVTSACTEVTPAKASTSASATTTGSVKQINVISAVLNLEDGLDLYDTYSPGQISDTFGGPRSKNVVFAGSIDLPSSFSQTECLWEHGGEGIGSWLGVSKINNVYFLRFRAGEGHASVQDNDPNDIALQNVPIALIPEFDGNNHEVVFDIRINPGRIRLWIDGRLVIDQDAGGTLEGSKWSGGNVGGWGGGYSAIAGGTSTYDSGATQYQSATSWSGGNASDLRLYNDQLVPFVELRAEARDINDVDASVTATPGTTATARDINRVFSSSSGVATSESTATARLTAFVAVSASASSDSTARSVGNVTATAGGVSTNDSLASGIANLEAGTTGTSTTDGTVQQTFVALASASAASTSDAVAREVVTVTGSVSSSATSVASPKMFVTTKGSASSSATSVASPNTVFDTTRHVRYLDYGEIDRDSITGFMFLFIEELLFHREYLEGQSMTLPFVQGGINQIHVSSATATGSATSSATTSLVQNSKAILSTFVVTTSRASKITNASASATGSSLHAATPSQIHIGSVDQSTDSSTGGGARGVANPATDGIIGTSAVADVIPRTVANSTASVSSEAEVAGFVRLIISITGSISSSALASAFALRNVFFNTDTLNFRRVIHIPQELRRVTFVTKEVSPRSVPIPQEHTRTVYVEQSAPRVVAIPQGQERTVRIAA